VKDALESLGLLSGFVPLDAMDDWGDVVYGGEDAQIAVTVGPQTKQILTSAVWRGDHRERLALLPLNSSYVPREMLSYGIGETEGAPVTRWLTPSRWSREKLEAKTSTHVTTWPHGISQAFRVNEKFADERFRIYRRGGLRALHMTSTTRQRKGTALLLRAWGSFIDKIAEGAGLVEGKMLDVVVPTTADLGEEISEALEGLSPVTRKFLNVLDNRNMSDEETAEYIGSHSLILQPSRGEGFGMVPLEALACGVPVVATACAGHTEFLGPYTAGTVIVPHGSEQPMDDGPGAMAPSVSVEDLEEAIFDAWVRWPDLHKAAKDAAPGIQAQWNWKSVMRDWAHKEGWI
jgi:glycosyltransferase involved in cell wall biosynthesis